MGLVLVCLDSNGRLVIATILLRKLRKSVFLLPIFLCKWCYLESFLGIQVGCSHSGACERHRILQFSEEQLRKILGETLKNALGKRLLTGSRHSRPWLAEECSLLGYTDRRWLLSAGWSWCWCPIECQSIALSMPSELAPSRSWFYWWSLKRPCSGSGPYNTVGSFSGRFVSSTAYQFFYAHDSNVYSFTVILSFLGTKFTKQRRARFDSSHVNKQMCFQLLDSILRIILTMNIRV